MAQTEPEDFLKEMDNLRPGLVVAKESADGRESTAVLMPEGH